MQINARSSRPWLTALLATAGLIAVAGCSSGRHQAAGTAPASPAPPATSPASTPPSTAPASSPASPTASPSSPAGQVPLGQLSGLFAHGSGFGQVRPTRIYNGGDPTGLVTQIVWRSWGSSRAIGTGQAEWIGPRQSVATGTQEPATVVAFKLGACNGKQMYRAVEWYFPQHGQSFSGRHYEDICSGSFVPGG